MREKLTIMLIDDSSSANLYHKIMMEDAGINVEECVHEFTSSTLAKEHLLKLYDSNLKAEFPKVILMDINMPMVNGWEMVAFLEGLELGTHRPEVYMVSNSRSPIDLEKAENYNIVVDILEKHVEVKFFEELLNASSKTSE